MPNVPRWARIRPETTVTSETLPNCDDQPILQGAHVELSEVGG